MASGREEEGGGVPGVEPEDSWEGGILEDDPPRIQDGSPCSPVGSSGSGDELGSTLEVDHVDAAAGDGKGRRRLVGAVAGASLFALLAGGTWAGYMAWDHRNDVAVPVAHYSLAEGDPCAVFTAARLGCTVDLVFSDDVPRDQLVSQSLAAGSTARGGKDSVVLSYSSGPESSYMPDLTGMGVDEARAALRALGVDVSEIRNVEAAGRAADTVVSSSTPAGVEISNGASVSLDVASGKVNLPDWTGRTREYVEADAKKIGVSVSFTEQESDGPAGVVLSQSVSSGEVDSSSEVSVVVSKAKADPEVEVPNVVGGSAAAAKDALVKAGFANVTVVTVRNSEVSSEQVTKVVPEAGTKAKAASTNVVVVVSQPYSNGQGQQSGR